MSGQHHLYGPSALRRRELCNASARMERAEWDKPDKDSQDAAEGRMLHAAVQDVVAGKRTLDSLAELDVEQREAVEFCVYTINSIKDQMAMMSFTIPEVKVEQMLHARDAEGGELNYGSADLVFRVPGASVIPDLKFGRNEVQAAVNNIQLASYALAEHDESGTPKVEAGIIQPRASRDKRVTRHCFTDFESIRGYIQAIIDKCEAPDASFNPCWEACHYCKAFEVCPAARDVREAPIVQAANKSLPAVCDLPDETLGDFYRRFKFAEKYAKEVKDELKGRAESNGGMCGGWELGKGSEERKVDDVAKAWVMVNSIVAPSPEEFMACCSLSLPKLEALVKLLLDGKGKGKTSAAKVKEMVAECLGDLILRSRREGSLKDKGVLAP